MPAPLVPATPAVQHLSPNVPVLGIVSLLMGMSSAMIYGVLPVFLVTVLGASSATVGLIEGTAEATTSLVKIISGSLSDRIGRRKPLVVAGYALSAVNKLLFPLAASAAMVLLARVCDRIGKGIRDSPRDAFMTDITPAPIRGTGFGLRLSLYTIGAIVGPLAAMTIMSLSGDDFRLVFTIALMPGFASVLVVLLWIKEPANDAPPRRTFFLRRDELASLSRAFWWAIAVAATLSLARFSPAFLVLKSHAVHIDAAFVPVILIFMYVVYSAAAYPFGVLADRIDRRMQLGTGIMVLVAADIVLAWADTPWMTMLGGALWGLQMGMTQGLLSATIADAAPERLRGTAFGIFDLVIGVTTFAASAGAGTLWMIGGPGLAYSAAAVCAVGALLLLLIRVPKRQ